LTDYLRQWSIANGNGQKSDRISAVLAEFMERFAEAVEQDEAEAREQEPHPPGVAQGGAEAQARALLSRLVQLDPRVSEEDYYDPELMTWDMEGLESDLQIELRGSAGTDGAEPKLSGAQAAQVDGRAEWVEGASSGDDPQSIFAQLLELGQEACKEDYFDAETGEWDVCGLQEDLDLMRNRQGATQAAQELQEQGTAQQQAVGQRQVALETEAAADALQNASADLAPLGVGDAVQAKFGDYGWYTALVHRDTGNGTYELRWDEDGTGSVVSRDQIQLLPPIAVGDSVAAVWAEDARWYDAVVQKDNGDGTYVVKYLEDNAETTLKKEDIRNVVDPPAETKFWAAPSCEGSAPPAETEQVEALCRDGEHQAWYSAVVQKDKGDGSFLLKWDEDGTVSSVKREDIRTLRPRFPVADLRSGQKYRGVVSTVLDIGAYVDIGTESAGLVHKSKMTTSRVGRPRDIVQPGQVVDVWLDTIGEHGKLHLVMDPDFIGFGSRPRADFSGFLELDPSTWLTGRVVRLQSWGLLVDVVPPSGGPPQQGTVHLSEINDGSKDDFQVGGEVQVRLDFVDDVGQGKLSFTMKEPV